MATELKYIPFSEMIPTKDKSGHYAFDAAIYNAKIVNATFSGGTIVGAAVSGLSFSGNALTNCTLNNCTMNGGSINNVPFSGITIEASTINRTTFNSGSIVKADINESTIRCGTFKEGSFSGGTIDHGTFCGGFLNNAKIQSGTNLYLSEDLIDGSRINSSGISLNNAIIDFMSGGVAKMELNNCGMFLTEDAAIRGNYSLTSKIVLVDSIMNDTNVFVSCGIEYMMDVASSSGGFYIHLTPKNPNSLTSSPTTEESNPQ